MGIEFSFGDCEVMEVEMDDVIRGWLRPQLMKRSQELLSSGAIDGGSYEPQRLSQVVLVAAMRDVVADFRANQREQEDLENLTHF